MKRVAEQLKEMGDAARRTQQSQNDAQKMMEMARRMAEQMTPEQQEQFRKLAQDYTKLQGPGSGPGDEPMPLTLRRPAAPRDAATRPVDARKSPDAQSKPSERVIAEWYSDRPIDRKPGEAEPAGPISEDFKKAAEAAERGSEQQQIPARYSDLVKRVFKRYAEQTARPPQPMQEPK